MVDASGKGANGADVGVAGCSHGDTLSSDSVLLVVILKRCGPSERQGCQWYDGGVVPSLLDKELYVTEAEGAELCAGGCEAAVVSCGIMIALSTINKNVSHSAGIDAIVPCFNSTIITMINPTTLSFRFQHTH